MTEQICENCKEEVFNKLEHMDLEGFYKCKKFTPKKFKSWIGKDISKPQNGCGKFKHWVVVREGSFKTGDTGEMKPFRCGDEGWLCPTCQEKEK